MSKVVMVLAGHRSLGGPWLAVGALVAMVAACGGSSATPAPSNGTGQAAAICPTPAAVKAIFSEIVKQDLTVSVAQGAGGEPQNTNCTYRSAAGNDVLGIQITVGDQARVQLDNTKSINTTNQSTTIAPLPLGPDAWVAMAPPTDGTAAPWIMAAGSLSGDIYTYVFYRYLAFPIPSGQTQVAPTTNQTIALINATVALQPVASPRPS